MEKQMKVNGGYPLHKFEDVEELYSTYIFNPDDRKLIRKAYDFIIEKHKNQFRKSGEPYYHHLIEVCYIVASLKAGPATLMTALLHDTVEDTDVTIADIKKGWGSEVSYLVDSLTKIQRLKLSKINAVEFDAQDHRKIFIGMARDIRVIIVKLADRLHNLRTLSSLAPERQIAMSKETMEVFVPIAHRLGLETIKTEMEDICLSYLEPEKYNEILNLFQKKSKIMKKSLESLKKKIADMLFEKGIPFEISARVKSIYSIYNKIYNKGHQFDEIYDILALRVITDNQIRCYEILGLIHKLYTPVPGRLKDYIAMPKPNLYQSLHTTVVSGDGNFFEVQIRTKEMDEIAEGGVAAHWSYKEGTGYNSKQEQREIENKLHWFRDFVSASNSMSKDSQASEYVENLTHDIFESNVYVFTPKGRVIELPSGSTPVDFAYRIHTKIGDATVGALVNGAMVPLSTTLKTGDMVEIKTSKNSNGPSEGWLDFVCSAQAKACIKRFLAKRDEESLKEEKIEKGKQSCIDAFKDKNISITEMEKYLNNDKLLEYFSVSSLEELYIAVSRRKPTSAQLIEYLKIKKPIDYEALAKGKTKTNSSCPVLARGAGEVAITLANCCTPIPGDEIVGYITKGKGITVHRKECPNIANEKERLVDVYWREDLESQTYPVDIMIQSTDRDNLLVDVMYALTSNKVQVNNLSAKSGANLTATITATLMVSDAKKLTDISNVILGINGVFNVSRIIH